MARARSTFKRDKNSHEVVACLRDRLGGYHKFPEYPNAHFANLRGLRVAAYDMNKVGGGYPDWEIFVSWFCLHFEIKAERPPIKDNPNNSGQFKVKMTDAQYYQSQLEQTEIDFHNRHPGIVITAWDRNMIYEWLCLAADFVLYVDGLAEQKQETVNLFFPKITTQEQYNHD